MKRTLVGLIVLLAALATLTVAALPAAAAEPLTDNLVVPLTAGQTVTKDFTIHIDAPGGTPVKTTLRGYLGGKNNLPCEVGGYPNPDHWDRQQVPADIAFQINLRAPAQPGRYDCEFHVFELTTNGGLGGQGVGRVVPVAFEVTAAGEPTTSSTTTTTTSSTTTTTTLPDDTTTTLPDDTTTTTTTAGEEANGYTCPDGSEIEVLDSYGAADGSAVVTIEFRVPESCEARKLTAASSEILADGSERLYASRSGTFSGEGSLDVPIPDCGGLVYLTTGEPRVDGEYEEDELVYADLFVKDGPCKGTPIIDRPGARHLDPARGTLPFTGARSTVPMLAVGLVMLTAGVVTLLIARRGRRARTV
jgi:hypothetical protein